MTFLASAFGLVRKPKPHDMCMVARATGICSRAFADSPLPARQRPGDDPREVAAGDQEAQRGEHGADHDPGRDRAHRGRRGEVAQVDGALVVTGDDVPPTAVVLVLLGERLHAGPRPVGHLQLGREPDQPARLPDPEVQLPVLGADELLVVAALLLQRLAPEDTEVHGLGRAGLSPGVEGGVPDPDLGGHGGGHRVLPVVLALGVHDAADVLRAGLLKEPYGGGDVVRRQHAVPVDADDDRMAGGLDRGVEGGRRPTGRVGDGVHARVFCHELGRDLVRTVRGRTDGDHDLHLAGVLLREDRLDGSAQMPLLVEDGHDDGHGGELHVGLGVHRGFTLPRTGDTARPAGCAAPVGRSYGPTVLTASLAHGRRPEVPRMPTTPPRSPRRPDPRRRAPRPPFGPLGADVARVGPCGRRRRSRWCSSPPPGSATR